MSRREETTSRSGWRDDWLTFGLVAVTATAVLTVGGVHASTQVALGAATTKKATTHVSTRSRDSVRCELGDCDRSPIRRSVQAPR